MGILETENGKLTWAGAVKKAEQNNNFPAEMLHNEIRQYKRWQAEVFFNEDHSINEGHTENLRNAKHRLLRRYIDGISRKANCSIRKKLHSMYLDFKNNYLTISVFAEHYRLEFHRTIKILGHGFDIHEKQFERR